MNDTDQTSREGINLAALFTTRAGLIFREQPTSDIGIDAQFETKDSSTGRLIAAQVKAGDSYFKRKTDTGYWHSVSARHRELWLNHSLPVIVVLCDLTTEKCYWELVTEETCIAAGESWKIHVPKANLIDREHLTALTEIASPIVAASDYTICSEQDVSSGVAKRISLDIIAHTGSRGLNKPMLGAIVRDGLKVGQQSQYARNSISASTHADKSSGVVWGFVYLREVDRPAAAWVCRFQWISPDLDPSFRPLTFSGESAGEGLVIDWKLDSDLASILDMRRETKADFLTKVDSLVAMMPPIQEMLDKITEAGGLGESTKSFSESATAFEDSWDDRHAPPQECQRLHQAVGEILATIGNAGLIWNPSQDRTLNQTLGLSRSYQADLARLSDDIAFLRREVR